jgi:3',5'-cyclic AMP phosphodiesterase CpdA
VREGSPDRTLRESPTPSLPRGRRSFLTIGRPTTLRVIVAASVLVLTSATAWTQPAPLAHPTVEQRLEELQISGSDGYRFVVLGDQKSLWKKEFPRLLDQIHSTSVEGDLPLLLMLDTGDFVDDGSRARQFGILAGLLDRVKNLPYLAGVGNHELKPKERFTTSRTARENTAAFLGPSYTPDRLYFSKQVGPVRFLFLNTSALPGLYPELSRNDPGSAGRASAQLTWLAQELQTEVHPTVVVSHHPFIQSAVKHHDHARELWNHEYRELSGRTLPEALIEGGVDLVLSGHVHSYEMFRLQREDRQMWTLNVSGRPAGWLQGSRMPRDWSRDPKASLEGRGFRTRLDQWSVTQETYMSDRNKVDQFALVTVGSDGRLTIELRSVEGPTLYRTQIP